jgi:hypothetical protein
MSQLRNVSAYVPASQSQNTPDAAFRSIYSDSVILLKSRRPHQPSKSNGLKSRQKNCK